MNISPNVNLDRIEEADFKLQLQYTKCLNEKQGQESQSDYLDELAGYISASASDMCSLSVNPDKCAILQETVNKICQIKLEECGSSDDLQKSEVSSSKPNLFGNDLVGPILLQALDGFLFMVNTDGKIEFVTANVKKFLKYSEESLIDKSIYNIIHVGDHARFSSNLLPMSIGNGFGWSEPNASVSKSRSFNCRFLVKPPEDQEETMEEKQTRISQYEEMQISAVLLPFSGERTEAEDLGADIQNHLVCVARRVPSNEKNSASPAVHFLTRLDLQGKIISIDSSGVPATYSQYLNKDLVGQNILELCYSDDVQKVTHHLKETLQQGSNTSGIYRLKLSHQKIIYVQTKSKRYTSMASEPEIIIANHTILRDSDRCLENNVVVSQRNNPSPASGSLAPSVGSNMNGNSYSFAALSPQDFMTDIGLDMFPSSSWDLGGGEEPNMGDGANLPSSLGGPSTPVSTDNINSGAQQRTQHPSGSAFSPELLSGRGSPSTRSPAQLSTTGSPAPGRVTPFSNTFPFSPVQTQTVSRTSSPAPNLIKREDSSLQSSNVELSTLSPMSGYGDCQNSTNNATQKLRNLLTHGIEEADSSVPKPSTEKMDETENGFTSRSNSDIVSSRNENIILRELLNQEEEEMRDESAKTLSCDSNCNVNLSSEMSSNDSAQKRTVNNNNMLRKLLNNDENLKKTQENLTVIQELLKTEGKVSVDNGNGQPKGLSNYDNSVMKRKSPDTPTDDSLAKRTVQQQNPQHAHLAGLNPMLASMLAQTPRTAPTVPTSVANAIVSQLPQERLPKNLEKKLVHTPYTGAPTSNTISTCTPNSQYSFSQVQVGARSLLSSHLSQEIVTADSRGHVTMAPHNTHNFPQANFLGKSLPNNFLGKVVQDANSADLNLQNYQNQYLQNSQNSLQPSNNQLLFDGMSETNHDSNNTAGTSDPLLSVILDQVYSMEEDMKLDNMSSDDMSLFKFLEEIPETVPAASPQPTSRDVNEKMAINAIQRQLMSFEVPGSTSVPRNNLRFQQPATMPMVMQQNQVVQNSYSQANQYQTSAPPAYTLSNQRTRAPGIHAMQNNVNMVPSSQQINNRQTLPQYGGLNLNDLSPQMKRQLFEQRQKLFAQQQQQQKRLMLQQKQQQLSLNTRQAIPENIPNLQSPATTQFPEGMNDLLNNTVAPNVTLQRSTSMPDPQLSPRYSNVQQIPNQSAPPSSPSQLSPGQRQQPPFSPMSQQGYPNNYPQSRLSPHMPSQTGPTQAWVQRASQNPANLQQQNPMLNAQLSQQASYGNQARFSNQQPQSRQIVVRSMPSPGSRNSPYSNPPDSPFHPPSPGVNLYQQQNSALPQQPAQAPQQRLQRSVSIPHRVNSPRGLPAGFTGGDPILSPQPSPGNYNPPVSTYNSPMPVSTSSNFSNDNFSYDQQVYPASMVDRNRGNGGNAMTSEYVRQEIRAMVGARTQQHQVHQQQIVQQMPQTPGSQSSNQSLSQADFEALGFSLDLGNDGQPSSPALFSQSLLSVAGANENQSRTSSPRFQMEEQRPTEQKKSLLQQLLSEPP